MAQINFPTATANGQEFEADNGVIYTYVGTPPNGYWSGTFQSQSYSTLDNRYLKLDSSNDPVTNGLNVSSGSVGIGTTSPSAKLTVSDPSGTGNINLCDLTAPAAGANQLVRLIGRNAANSGTTSVDFFKTYQSGFGIHNNDTDASNFTRFVVGASERMRIDSSGKVGIGTTTPSDLLSVRSDAGSAGTSVIGSGNAYLILDSSVGNTSGNQLSFIDFKDDGVLQANISVNEATSGQPLEINSATSNDVVIATGGGNVGIGVSDISSLGAANSPAFGVGGAAGNRLGIYGNGGRWWYMHGEGSNTLTFGARISSNTGDADILAMNSNGNVGIGDSTPESALSINTGGTLRLGKQEEFMISGQPIGGLYFGNITNPSGGIECDWQGVNNPTVAIGVTRDKSTGNNIKAQTRYQYDATIRNLIQEQEVMRIQAGGLAMASGKSIVFNSNTPGLDDYEEGSWTPTINSGITNPALQTAAGRYTKIGNVVHLFCFLDISAGNIGGTLTGDGIITGLPYVISNNPSSTDVHGSACDNLKSIPNTFSSQRNNAMLYFPPGQNYLAIHQYSTVNPIYQTGWGMSQIGNGNRFKWAWTGQYRTDQI